ncbi:MAG: hypothetical protein M1825_003942 [Sarcosagium campestre]|nr:MAG: hypothetical protein M1825_003942 [Sarcosagium campestre]
MKLQKTSSKKQAAQEMVQVDRSEPASPFWRSRSSSARQESPRRHDPAKVVGAAYSHADMLKFDSLSISSDSRPRTPPVSSLTNARFGSPPKSSPASIATPPRRTYTEFLSHTNDEWNAEEDDEDDGEGDEVYGYDDENEDEFGLPRLANMKRKKSKRLQSTTQATDPGIGYSAFLNGRPQSSGNKPNTGRRRANSSDIAEERGQPNYPTAEKNEGKILRPQYKEILRDPANSLHLIQHSPLPPNSTPKEAEAHSSRITRINKFKRILQASSISLSDLRNNSWNGIPEEVRAMSWQLLLGYLPTSSERRVATVERKRKEYLDGVRQAFDRGAVASADTGGGTDIAGAKVNANANAGRGRGLDESIWHQISIDVPRTNPHLELYGYEATQRSLERILYVWAIRHPASGYVQGINDLVTPFWQVFLGSYISDANVDCGMDPGQLPRAVLDAVEADSFWCLTKLLDGIQDNYTIAQPGIQRQVGALRDLTVRIDAALAKHLDEEGVQFIQFSFRWMNCLLMREVSVKNTIRMWDTYLAEEQGFSEFHLYVCAAFLVKWSDQLVKMDFQARNNDVPTSTTDPELDRKRHGITPERGIHLAESFSGFKRASPSV